MAIYQGGAMSMVGAAAKKKPPATLPGDVQAPATSPLQQQAQAEINPIIAALTAAANTQAANSDAAIQGLTDSYAKELAAINYGAPYSSGEASQAAVDAALQQELSGGGNTLAQGLSGQLSALQGSSGEQAVQNAANALSSQGLSAGNTAAASGSAALGQLIADAAAANEYGTKMPGVVKLAGLQGVEQAQGQAQQAINQGTLQAESDLPTIMQQLKSDKLQAQATKAEAQATKAEAGYKNAQLALSARKDAISESQGSQRIQIAAARAAQTAFNENRSYQLAASRLGIENKRLQLEALTQETKLQNGGFTPTELVGLRKTAYGVLANAQTNHYTRAQALNNLAANGVPLSVAKPLLKKFGYQDMSGADAKSIVSAAIQAGQLFPQLRKPGGGAPFRRRRK